ncbi:NUDIX domain-containing protein [Candidatus Giovannonibacteria bacterium]|nr:NUDIX domain-containing protein [Candidatus Giovannonibacteria bacterium]
MKKRNGAIVTKSEVKYDKYGLKVVEENFEHELNKQGLYRYIEMVPQVRVVPVTESGDFILIQEFKYPQDEYILCFPAGSVEKGETSLEAAKRELEEETSLTTETFIDLGAYHPMASTLRQDAKVFLAINVRPILMNNGDTYERSNIKTVKASLEGLFSAIANNRLNDGQALAAICKVFVAMGCFHGSKPSADAGLARTLAIGDRFDLRSINEDAKNARLSR